MIAGCEAHVCLLQTALDLLEDEFEVWVVTDACSSRTERNRDAAFDRLAGAGAELVTTEMVGFEWLRTAEHPRFRELQALIRWTAGPSRRGALQGGAPRRGRRSRFEIGVADDQGHGLHRREHQRGAAEHGRGEVAELEHGRPAVRVRKWLMTRACQRNSRKLAASTVFSSRLLNMVRQMPACTVAAASSAMPSG